MENLLSNLEAKDLYQRIDHVAIAVRDLSESIFFYQQILGFELQEKRETQGRFSGMISAVLSSHDFTVVLLQGTGPESQISRYIQQYGPGVQHIAFEVENLERVAHILSARGVRFSTQVIRCNGMSQIFSERDSNSGMMIELIERQDRTGFDDRSVQDLFLQLEGADLL